MAFYSGSGLEAHKTFMDRLKAAGIELYNRYEVGRYSGPPLRVDHALARTRAFFWSDALVVATDREELGWIAKYLQNHPRYRQTKFYLRETRSTIADGAFSLVQRDGFEGGTPDGLAAIIRESGGDDEGVRFALEGETKTLGFFVTTDRRTAEELAHAIHVGATSPSSHEDVVKLREALVRHARQLSQQDPP